MQSSLNSEFLENIQLNLHHWIRYHIWKMVQFLPYHLWNSYSDIHLTKFYLELKKRHKYISWWEPCPFWYCLILQYTCIYLHFICWRVILVTHAAGGKWKPSLHLSPNSNADGLEEHDSTTWFITCIYMTGVNKRTPYWQCPKHSNIWVCMYIFTYLYKATTKSFILCFLSLP